MVKWYLNNPVIVHNGLVSKTVKSTLKKWLVFGHLVPLVPPVELKQDSASSCEVCKQNSYEFSRLFVVLCGLTPDGRILHIGRVIGRQTIRLSHYLGWPGRTRASKL